jgi:hypothetical protein
MLMLDQMTIKKAAFEGGGKREDPAFHPQI